MNNLTFQVVDEIATITIQRPKALNALNTETLTELHTLFEEITSRKDIRVVILTGDGEKSFVAGADISEMVHFSAAEGRTFGKLAAETFFLLENLRGRMPKVV